VKSNEPTKPQRPSQRSRLAVGVAFLALLATVGAPRIADAQIDPGANGNLIITNADTPDFPSDPNPIAICINGQGPTAIEIGSDQIMIEEPAPGPIVVDVYDNDAASCSDAPDHSISVPLTAGGLQGLVIGSEGLATFTYDTDCVDAGTSRVYLVNSSDRGPSAAMDVYGFDEGSGQYVPLALALQPNAVAYLPAVPAGQYLIQAYEPGVDPNTSPPIGPLGVFDLDEGYSTQIFIAGGSPNGELGPVWFQQGPEVCGEAEELPPTTSSSTSSTTSTTIPTGTEAAAATPVAGSPTFTG
jgi:hypothetical protein